MVSVNWGQFCVTNEQQINCVLVTESTLNIEIVVYTVFKSFTSQLISHGGFKCRPCLCLGHPVLCTYEVHHDHFL